MSKLRVFLVDDHAVVREGLKALVGGQADMRVVGEAANGQVACQALTDATADVVVVDVAMPEMNGAELTRWVKRKRPDTKVIALTVHEDKAYLRQLLEAGATGYVLKRAAADELIAAIRVVAGGGVHLDPSMASKVVGSFLNRSSGKDVLQECDLSARETEVVRLVARGYTNKEIASQLDLSIKTIETYKSRVMEKLGLRTRAEIVRYAMHQGWLT